MSCKRDGKKLPHDETEWDKWRKEYADLIDGSGLPDLVVSDINHWYDFLDHSYLDHHEDPLHFSLHHLTVRQKAFCLQLIGMEELGFNTVAGSDLISDLISAVKNRYRE